MTHYIKFFRVILLLILISILTNLQCRELKQLTNSIIRSLPIVFSVRLFNDILLSSFFSTSTRENCSLFYYWANLLGWGSSFRATHSIVSRSSAKIFSVIIRLDKYESESCTYSLVWGNRVSWRYFVLARSDESGSLGFILFLRATTTPTLSNICHDIRIIKSSSRPILPAEWTSAANGTARAICLHYFDVPPDHCRCLRVKQRNAFLSSSPHPLQTYSCFPTSLVSLLVSSLRKWKVLRIASSF